MLGSALAMAADTEALKSAYGEFQQEALRLKPDYAPQSVNTDGWEATQQAWQSLFPSITLVLCFLHTVLGILQHCRRDKALSQAVREKLWAIYHAGSPLHFMSLLRKLPAWALEHVSHEKMLDKLFYLDAKAPQFLRAFDLPGAHRTSNQVDRLMNFQDRWLDAMQYFHGSQAAAGRTVRAMALIWNFHPYCQKVQAKAPHARSPFEALNGFRYHDNWLQNLLIASSLNGRGGGKSKKHRLSEN
jgi:hypothetical protein